MAMWISVNDADNRVPIANATFSVGWYNQGDGNYYVYIDPNQTFWCDAPDYETQYAQSNGYQSMQISLRKEPKTGWP